MSDPWFEGLPNDPFFGIQSHSASLSRSNSNPTSSPMSTARPSKSGTPSENVEPGQVANKKPPINKIRQSSFTCPSTPSSKPVITRHDSFPKEVGNKNNMTKTTSPASSSSSAGGTPSPSHHKNSIHSSPKPLTRFQIRSPSVVNEVHERVINDMLSRKMISSKERIERALRLSRAGSSGSARSSFSSLPVLGEGVPMDSTCFTPKNSFVDESTPPPSQVNQSIEDDRVNDGYITATYNIIKDRIMKEMHGFPCNNTSSPSGSQEVMSSYSPSFSNANAKVSNVVMSGNHTKKSHVFPERRKRAGVSKPPSIGRLDDRSLKKQLLEEQENEDSKNIIEEESAGFTLPLQRKCSIVSEEGSCDLSGRLSDTGSETLHTILLTDEIGQDEGGTSRKNSSVPSVDIVITDLSQIDKEVEETSRIRDNEDKGTIMACQSQAEYRFEEEDLAEDVELTDIREDDEEADDMVPDSKSRTQRNMNSEGCSSAPVASPEFDEVEENMTCKSGNRLTAGTSLPMASSSPDLARDFSDPEGKESRDSSCTRPVTMYIDDTPPSVTKKKHKKRGSIHEEDEIIDDVATKRREMIRRNSRQAMMLEHSLESSNVCTPSRVANNNNPNQSGASMRVITSSKSCSNILVNENSMEEKRKWSRKSSSKSRGSTQTAQTEEASKQEVKEKSKKNDCCVIT